MSRVMQTLKSLTVYWANGAQRRKPTDSYRVRAGDEGVGAAGLQAHPGVPTLGGDRHQVGQHGPGDALPTGSHSGVHRLHLAVRGVDSLSAPTPRSTAAAPGAEERDGVVGQPVGGQRMHVLGGTLVVRESQVRPEKLLHVGRAGVVDRDGQVWHTVPCFGSVPWIRYASTASSMQLLPRWYAVCPSPTRVSSRPDVEHRREVLGPLVRRRGVAGGADDEDRCGTRRVDLVRLVGRRHRPDRARDVAPREVRPEDRRLLRQPRGVGPQAPGSSSGRRGPGS